MLTIIGSEYNPAHNALEIYVSGCKRNCPGCHNPEAQAFGKGKSTRLWMQENTYKLKTGTFNKVWILGGDLLDQPQHDAVEFMTSLRLAMPHTMQLWLWTGAVEDVQGVPVILREFFDVIKTGAYKKNLYPVKNEKHGIVLASSNQKFTDMRKEASCALLTSPTSPTNL